MGSSAGSERRPFVGSRRRGPPSCGPLDGLVALLRDRTLRQALAELERSLIVDVLRRHRGNVSASARRLDLDRVTLVRKIARHGLRAHTSRRRGRPPDA